MRCLYCNHLQTDVLDKRDAQDGSATRRRRSCRSCKKRFTTYERIENVPLVIIKKGGTRESFDRNKLKIGVMKSCEKLPIAMDTVDSIVNDIEKELRQAHSTEVESRKVGQLVMEHLKKIDMVAYIRFASVYKEFADLEDFADALKSLQKSQKTKK